MAAQGAGGGGEGGVSLVCKACDFHVERCPRCGVRFQDSGNAEFVNLHMRDKIQRYQHCIDEQKDLKERNRLFISKAKNVSIFQVDVKVKTSRIGANEEGQSQATVPPRVTDTEGRTAAGKQTDVSIYKAEHVTMNAVSMTVELQDTRARLEHITDQDIQHAVGDVLITKVSWDDALERQYRQEMQRAADREQWLQLRQEDLEIKLSEERQRLLLQIEKGREEVSEIAQQLTAVLSESERESSGMLPDVAILREKQKESDWKVELLTRQLEDTTKESEERQAALRRCFDDRERNVENVKTFLMKLDERDQSILRQMAVAIETVEFSDVIKVLFDDNHIRMLGVDSGMSFLMEAPLSQWETARPDLLNRVRDALMTLIPRDLRQAASFSLDVDEYANGVDLHLGRPLPGQSPQVSGVGQERLCCVFETCSAQGIKEDVGDSLA